MIAALQQVNFQVGNSGSRKVLKNNEFNRCLIFGLRRKKPYVKRV